MSAASLQKKIIAVGSGKGGVGKSTTSANLAVLAAREGLRVALVDLDPLSDLSVIFDLGPEIMARAKTTMAAGTENIVNHRIQMFPRLDLLFPHVKLKKGEPARLRSLIFTQFRAELEREYDLLILDLPAGIGQEENLAFLPFIQNLVIVTNAEPTSHVSAGGYIKAAREINPALQFFLWHNKFEPAVDADFNPRTLWENYNRYVPEDLSLEPEARTAMRDIAFVPLDASLNLLHADAEYQNHLLGKFLEVLNLIDEQVVAELPEESEVPKPLRIIIRHHVLHMKKTNVKETTEYLASVVGKPGFRLPLDQQIYLEKYLEVQNRHPVRARIDETRQAVSAYLDNLASDGSMFGSKTATPGADRLRLQAHSAGEIRKLLDLLARLQSPQHIARAPWPRKNAAMMRNLSGLLLFYFALYRLMEVKSVQGLLSNFVPHKRLANGTRVRSRYRQISQIIKEDSVYHKNYFDLIKRLFPVILKQLGMIVQSRSWQELVFRSPDGKAHHNAYLKLLGRTIHDTINGGLGIHVGIRHNAAAMAIQQGGKALLTEIGAVTQH